ncbi:unnamed protein product [Closterium sp. Naga37s-1]|nr:unnamed protein product [Closterium sp. Naga37s-1]
MVVFVCGTAPVCEGVCVVLLRSSLLQLLYIWLVRHRILFSATILKHAVHVVNTFPSVIWVAYLFLLLSLVWTVVWVVGVSGAMALVRAMPLCMPPSSHLPLHIMSPLHHVASTDLPAALPSSLPPRALWCVCALPSLPPHHVLCCGVCGWAADERVCGAHHPRTQQLLDHGGTYATPLLLAMQWV